MTPLTVYVGVLEFEGSPGLPSKWRYWAELTDPAGTVVHEVSGLSRTRLLAWLKTYRNDRSYLT